jgi:hypothetical protein
MVYCEWETKKPDDANQAHKVVSSFPNGFVSLVDSFLNRTYVTHAIVSLNDDT